MTKTAIPIRCKFCTANFQSAVNGLVRVQQKYEVICPKCSGVNNFINTCGFIGSVSPDAIEALAVK
jgi:hypothetical protein